ncbi:hypothetical protein QBC32DRAFT_246888 [Pseudoneurospora amorphoporcata]|uniref:4Fe-4S ferredoxin-type domain-containing protein n=1 Tax=Pseudoneurospora amorphoporcata TaxID=241081 RepID=A0AAN6NPM9_9PEZI|nr:hypothetical protein QBC32DRAFT_246888 [Pseudoneurospora amorphoporcata]
MFIKAALVFVAVLGPEAVFALAFQEFLDARRLKKKLEEIIIANEKGSRCGGCKKCVKCKTLAMVDMKFCYFIVMGGLQVDISDIKPSDYVRFHFHGDNMPEMLPLSADGVIEFAMLGYLDKLLVENTVIEDKSKGALVQKCVVLVQVAWMGIQCIARKAEGYPVSLLELHTFGHVVVAMLLYLCWLNKPLDVRQPVFVKPHDFKNKQDTEGFQDALALMVQEQFCDLQNLTGFLNLKWKQEQWKELTASEQGGSPDAVKPQTSRIVISQKAQGSTPLPTPADQPQQLIVFGRSTTDSQDTVRRVSIEGPNQPDIGDPETFDLGVNQQLSCGFGHMPVSQRPSWKCVLNRADDWRVNMKTADRPGREEDKLPIRLTRADRCRAERAARHIKVVEKVYNIKPVEQPEPYAYKRYGSTGQHYRYLNLTYKTAFQSLKFEVDKLNPLAAKRTSDSEELKSNTIDVHRKGLCEESCPRLITRYAAFLDAIFNGIGGVSRFVCTIISVVIGAIHLAAWDSVFPGRVESIIWKIASVTMMATVPAVLWYRFQVVYLQRYNFQYHRLGYQTPHLWLTRFLNAWYFFLAIIFLLFFIAVRGYLIVESLISVRHMAYGTYFVPDWLQVFPHI